MSEEKTPVKNISEEAAQALLHAAESALPYLLQALDHFQYTHPRSDKPLEFNRETAIGHVDLLEKAIELAGQPGFQKGLEAVIRLKNVEIARLEVALWYEKFNHSSYRHDRSRENLEEAQRISREGS